MSVPGGERLPGQSLTASDGIQEMQDTEDSMRISPPRNVCFDRLPTRYGGLESGARWRHVSFGWCWLPAPSPASTLGVVRSARFTWSQCKGMLTETGKTGEVDRPCRP